MYRSELWIEMKYVIQCNFDTTLDTLVRLQNPVRVVSVPPQYYAGEHLRERVGPKLSNALVFDTPEQAKQTADELPKSWFVNIKKVSNKELFEAKLKGI